MLRLVRALDRASHTISIGSCAPEPMVQLVQHCSMIYPEMAISSEMKDIDYLKQGLDDDIYQCIILPQKPSENNYVVEEYGHENLYFALPKSHPKSNSKSLSFSDRKLQVQVGHSAE